MPTKNAFERLSNATPSGLPVGSGCSVNSRSAWLALAGMILVAVRRGGGRPDGEAGDGEQHGERAPGVLHGEQPPRVRSLSSIQTRERAESHGLARGGSRAAPGLSGSTPAPP